MNVDLVHHFGAERPFPGTRNGRMTPQPRPFRNWSGARRGLFGQTQGQVDAREGGVFAIVAETKWVSVSEQLRCWPFRTPKIPRSVLSTSRIAWPFLVWRLNSCPMFPSTRQELVRAKKKSTMCDGPLVTWVIHMILRPKCRSTPSDVCCAQKESRHRTTGKRVKMCACVMLVVWDP